MTSKEAVAIRINELCRERDLAVNALANLSGMPPTTIYSMLTDRSMNPGVSSINKICNGLDITLREFFSSPIFDELDQEIK